MDNSVVVLPHTSDGSTSDETESPTINNSKNLNQSNQEAKTSDDRRRNRDSGDKRHSTAKGSKGSNKSGEEDENTEDNQILGKMDKKKIRSSEKFNKSNRKASTFEYDDDDVFQDSSIEQPEKIINRRTSVAIDLKRKSTQNLIEDEAGQDGKKRRHSKYPLRNLSKKSLSGDGDNTELEVNQSNKVSIQSTRKEAEKSDDSPEETDAADELETAAEETWRKERALSRPLSAHIQRVLSLINEGSEVQLKALARVGPKTATMLHQYRKLHGRLTSIRDLENMPGWTPKVFQQFVNANNIILD